MNEAKVLKIQQTNTFGPTGNLVKTYLVQFMVGESGPFTEQFTQDDFTPDKIKKRLAEFATTINALPQAK